MSKRNFYEKHSFSLRGKMLKRKFSKIYNIPPGCRENCDSMLAGAASRHFNNSAPVPHFCIPSFLSHAVIPTVPEIIDPVFAKTSPKRSFSMTEYERFGLVFTKTRVYKFGQCQYLFSRHVPPVFQPCHSLFSSHVTFCFLVMTFPVFQSCYYLFSSHVTIFFPVMLLLFSSHVTPCFSAMLLPVFQPCHSLFSSHVTLFFKPCTLPVF
jgi:hypothetical protein